MTDLNLETRKARARLRQLENPIGLLCSIIAAKPKASVAEHIKEFVKLMRLESYEEYADAVADEGCRIKYSTAPAAAVPPTATEIEEARKRRFERQKAEQEAVARVKSKLVGKVLDHVMPNGKTLGNNTGPELVAFGGWFAAIGERVGNRKVKDVLSERQLIKLGASLGLASGRRDASGEGRRNRHRPGPRRPGSPAGGERPDKRRR